MNTTTTARIRAAERRRIALQLRADGLTYQAIADHVAPDGERLFASRQSAARAIARELRDIPAEEADAVRAIELVRLDELHANVWPEATRPGGPLLCEEHAVPVECPECGAHAHKPVNLQAINGALRIAERRASLLGLDYTDRTERRAVEILEWQASLTHNAMTYGLEQAGLDATTTRTVFEHAAAYYRALEEDDAEDVDVSTDRRIRSQLAEEHRLRLAE